MKKKEKEFDIFTNYTFSGKEWSAPTLKYASEIKKELEKMQLVGRRIKKMKMIGLSYYLTRDWIESAAYNMLSHLPEDERQDMSNYKNISPDMEFSRYQKKVGVYMFYYSNESRSKVVHYEGCHHLKNIKKENLRSFYNVKEIRSSEYRICSCCSPITEHLKKEQVELENFCQENGLAYFVNKGNLHIRTYHSKWKVLVSNNKDVLELHHENSYEKEHDNSVPGYHRQNYISDSIIGYMEYITNHEYYRMYNPVPVFTKKEPPMKGTKRWNKQQKAIKRKERRREIWNVMNLIDSLSVGACVAHA